MSNLSHIPSKYLMLIGLLTNDKELMNLLASIKICKITGNNLHHTQYKEHVY